MLLKTDVVVECLVTMTACVRFLSCMSSLVPSHVAFLCKPPSAEGAGVPFALCVGSKVFLQSGVGFERFPALLADVISRFVV